MAPERLRLTKLTKHKITSFRIILSWGLGGRQTQTHSCLSHKIHKSGFPVVLDIPGFQFPHVYCSGSVGLCWWKEMVLVLAAGFTGVCGRHCAHPAAILGSEQKVKRD